MNGNSKSGPCQQEQLAKALALSEGLFKGFSHINSLDSVKTSTFKKLLLFFWFYKVEPEAERLNKLTRFTHWVTVEMGFYPRQSDYHCMGIDCSFQNWALTEERETKCIEWLLQDRYILDIKVWNNERVVTWKASHVLLFLCFTVLALEKSESCLLSQLWGYWHFGLDNSLLWTILFKQHPCHPLITCQ